MATLKDGTTVGGSLVHTHKTLPILIIDGNLTHGGAVVFDTKNRPSFSSLTDNVIDVRTDSVIINTSKGNTSATIYDNGVFELKKAHVPYFTVEATGNIIGKIEWSRVQSKPIVGTTGTSTTNIMHQKAVSDNLDKKLNIGDFGVGAKSSPRITKDQEDGDMDIHRPAGFYSVAASVPNTPDGAGSGDSLIEWGWDGNNYTQIFMTGDGNLHTRKRSFGKFREWKRLATLDELNKINDGIKNRLIKDGGKLITTGSAETLLDNVDLGDYNQYMFTNNQYLGLESPTNFYIQTMEAEDQSIVQMGYPIMTQRAKERGVPNRIIMRNRSPWRDATNAIKRHDWTDWSLTLVNQDLTKTIANSVANASDEKIPTEKAIKRELNKMIVGGTVVNEQGTSTVNVMNQRATTEGLNTKWDIVSHTGYAPDKNIDDYEAGEGGYSRKSNGSPIQGLDIITKSQFGSTDLLQIGLPQRSINSFMMRTKGSAQGGWGEWFEFYHTANTQVDSKGVIHNGTRKPIDVLLTGDYGLGGFADIRDTDLNDKNLVSTGLSSYYVVSTKNVPTTANGTMISIMHDVKKQWGSQFFIETSTGDSYIRTTSHLTNWDKWRKLYDDGNTTKDKNGVIHEGTKTPLDTLNTSNVVQTGGSSTSNVPSQKFVTDQLGTKIDDHGALGTKNLDTVIQYGMHHQTANANATTARKYPVALAGTLWVLPSAGVTQIYVAFSNGQRTFTRNNYGNKWSNWVETLDMTDIVSALGNSAVKVPSQKLVTDEFKKVNDNLNSVIDNTVVELRKDIAKKSDTTYVNTELGKKRDMSNNTFGSVMINGGDYAQTTFRSGSKEDVIIERTPVGAMSFIKRNQNGSNVNTISLPLNNSSGIIALTSDVAKKRDLTNNTFSGSISLENSSGQEDFGLQYRHLGVLRSLISYNIPYGGIMVHDYDASGKWSRAITFPQKTGTIALTSDVSSNKVKYASVKTYRFDKYNTVANNPFGHTRIWGYFKNGAKVGIIQMIRFDESYIFCDDPVGTDWDVHIWTDV